MTMKVEITDTFIKSLRKMSRHNTWWYKTYELFRYDIWRFFRNVVRFRKELWNFYPWDSSYNLRLLKRSLELTANNLELHGMEVSDSRLKKIAKIRRAVELIGNYCDTEYYVLAERELGKELSHGGLNFEPVEGSDSFRLVPEAPEVEASNKEIYDRAHEIEEAQWKELWSILQGQDYSDFRKSLTPEIEQDHEKSEETYRNWFDGSGMKGWWD